MPNVLLVTDPSQASEQVYFVDQESMAAEKVFVVTDPARAHKAVFAAQPGQPGARPVFRVEHEYLANVGAARPQGARVSPWRTKWPEPTSSRPASTA